MRTSILSCSLLAAAACRNAGESRTQGNPAQTASIYTAANESTATKNALPQTHAAKDLEAPERLRGFLPILDRMSKAPLSYFNENVTAYKFELARVIDAMSADLTRARLPEGKFRERAQRVMDELGGGTGRARPLSEEERRKHIADVQQLIQMYETAMQTKRPPGEAR
jgi:hypothetical protein